METKKKEQEEDERREELIASTPSLQPNFKAKGGITHAQLSKFQVLFRNLYSLSMLFFFFFSFSLIPIYVQFCMLLNPFCDFICVLSCGDFCMIRGLSVCENCRQYSIQITVIFLSNFV
jgi:hypothetical protein